MANRPPPRKASPVFVSSNFPQMTFHSGNHTKVVLCRVRISITPLETPPKAVSCKSRILTFLGSGYYPIRTLTKMSGNIYRRLPNWEISRVSLMYDGTVAHSGQPSPNSQHNSPNSYHTELNRIGGGSCRVITTTPPPNSVQCDMNWGSCIVNWVMVGRCVRRATVNGDLYVSI